MISVGAHGNGMVNVQCKYTVKGREYLLFVDKHYANMHDYVR